MTNNKENLEGIIAKLREQGINAGETEKQRLVSDAQKKADDIIAEAERKKNQILEEARLGAAQLEKNANIAITQAARDMVEATKIAMIDNLKSIFGTQCESLFTQKQYLEELTKAVLSSVSGNKTVHISPELQKHMEAFLLKQALSEQIELKPLASSQAKIEVKSTENKGVQFVLSAKDVEDGLFSLINKDLIRRITENKEA
ncbi:hypothetical protein [Mangrovibacterium sp.]|uniref:hypothetical protein n=1 Tax=Mangrovibacterium sp. TaxID=1961364 RepID=UPI003561CF96